MPLLVYFYCYKIAQQFAPCSIERLYHQQFAHRPHTTILINVSQNIFHLCSRKKRKLLQLLACRLIQVNRMRCQAAQQIVIFLIHQPLLLLRNHQLVIQPLPIALLLRIRNKGKQGKNTHQNTVSHLKKSVFHSPKKVFHLTKGNFFISQRPFSHLAKVKRLLCSTRPPINQTMDNAAQKYTIITIAANKTR